MNALWQERKSAARPHAELPTTALLEGVRERVAALAPHMRRLMPETRRCCTGADHRRQTDRNQKRPAEFVSETETREMLAHLLRSIAGIFAAWPSEPADFQRLRRFRR